MTNMACAWYVGTDVSGQQLGWLGMDGWMDGQMDGWMDGIGWDRMGWGWGWAGTKGSAGYNAKYDGKAIKREWGEYWKTTRDATNVGGTAQGSAKHLSHYNVVATNILVIIPWQLSTF